jgi:hypothetical protein
MLSNLYGSNEHECCFKKRRIRNVSGDIRSKINTEGLLNWNTDNAGMVKSNYSNGHYFEKWNKEY